MSENNEKPVKKKPNPDEEVHVIDGIVELNQPPPFWWQSIFYISIVWAIFYAGYYILGSGPTLSEELAANLLKIEMRKVSAVISPEKEKEELRANFNSPERLAQGMAVYKKNCLACHAETGGGGIGPNLADRYWIHGDGSIDAMLKVVREGVSDKGMPPWGPILKREEILLVTAFVRSLRGTTPDKPKAPQGTAVEYAKDI